MLTLVQAQSHINRRHFEAVGKHERCARICVTANPPMEMHGTHKRILNQSDMVRKTLLCTFRRPIHTHTHPPNTCAPCNKQDVTKQSQTKRMMRKADMPLVDNSGCAWLPFSAIHATSLRGTPIDNIARKPSTNNKMKLLSATQMRSLYGNMSET